MPTPTYDLIASNVLTSSASSVTFSSIPATYRDLVLVTEHSAGVDASTFFRFNSDTGSNYNRVRMTGDGSSATSGAVSNATSFPINSGPDTILAVLQILDYSATDKHKTLLCRTGRAGSQTAALANRWASTSAINTITITQSDSNFNSGSTFYLYGIA